MASRIDKMLRRQDRCVWCDRPFRDFCTREEITVEHLLPRRSGRRAGPIALACWACNQRRAGSADAPPGAVRTIEQALHFAAAHHEA